MRDRPDAALQEKLNERLRFYEDLGLGPFYRDRGVAIRRIATSAAVAPETLSVAIEESTLRKAVPKLTPAVKTLVPEPAARLPILPTATGLSLFEASDKILGDTLLKTREDLGECTRCTLHKHCSKQTAVSPIFAANGWTFADTKCWPPTIPRICCAIRGRRAKSGKIFRKSWPSSASKSKKTRRNKRAWAFCSALPQRLRGEARIFWRVSRRVRLEICVPCWECRPGAPRSSRGFFSLRAIGGSCLTAQAGRRGSGEFSR